METPIAPMRMSDQVESPNQTPKSPAPPAAYNPNPYHVRVCSVKKSPRKENGATSYNIKSNVAVNTQCDQDSILSCDDDDEIMEPKKVVVFEKSIEPQRKCPFSFLASKQCLKIIDICLLILAVVCVVINLAMCFTMGYHDEENTDYAQVLFFSMFPLIAYFTCQLVSKWITNIFFLCKY